MPNDMRYSEVNRKCKYAIIAIAAVRELLAERFYVR